MLKYYHVSHLVYIADNCGKMWFTNFATSRKSAKIVSGIISSEFTLPLKALYPIYIHHLFSHSIYALAYFALLKLLNT